MRFGGTKVIGSTPAKIKSPRLASPTRRPEVAKPTGTISHFPTKNRKGLGSPPLPPPRASQAFPPSPVSKFATPPAMGNCDSRIEELDVLGKRHSDSVRRPTVRESHLDAQGKGGGEVGPREEDQNHLQLVSLELPGAELKQYPFTKPPPATKKSGPSRRTGSARWGGRPTGNPGEPGKPVTMRGDGGCSAGRSFGRSSAGSRDRPLKSALDR